MKAYLYRFNKERLATDDQDETIMPAVLLGGIWPLSPFMAKVSRRTPATLWDYMDRVDDFVNVEDTLWALTMP